VEDRTFTASEVLMLMLDCGTSAAQLFGEVPGFRMQAEFILSSKDSNDAKRLAFHSLLLNVASKILTDYVRYKDDEAKQDNQEESGGNNDGEPAEG
jgi:hypothetical protein